MCLSARERDAIYCIFFFKEECNSVLNPVSTALSSVNGKVLFQERDRNSFQFAATLRISGEICQEPGGKKWGRWRWRDAVWLGPFR